jgi:hypothetical protein
MKRIGVMNCLILISPYKGSGFKTILSGNFEIVLIVELCGIN